MIFNPVFAFKSNEFALYFLLSESISLVIYLASVAKDSEKTIFSLSDFAI